MYPWQLKMSCAALMFQKQHLEHLEQEKQAMAKSLALTAAEKEEMSCRFQAAMAQIQDIQQRFTKLTGSLEDEKSKNASLQQNVR